MGDSHNEWVGQRARSVTKTVAGLYREAIALKKAFAFAFSSTHGEFLKGFR
ncbi:MAG TPA: hypothetical protein VL987_15380 [Cellvibrio sp.]|nr:hypothetical protein [Cellvibrio sp.]